MSTEREFDRTHAAANAAQVDNDVAPNRATKSSRLDAPRQPEASGLVMRKARDANGVGAGADDAVARASSSSGSSLPETLMRKFESSLDADLSSVRVHAGGESAAAADAVGARAYTIGQDIHFGAGQYDPGSSGGEHLLAHEVAHTVQQRGEPPARQNKLEVSSPDDGAEHEADRAADAMIAGAAFAIGGSSASAARKVFRERKWDWGVGGKITPVADGFVKFQVEGNAKVEQALSLVTAAGQISAGVEGEVKWKPESSGAGISGKGSSGKDGKQSQQWEMEVPLWKAEAKKVAQAEAEKSWTDHFAPVDASLVLGAEGSAKPGHDAVNRTLAESKKEKPGEAKGALAVGIKCKTRSGDSFTVKVQLFELAKKGGKVLDVSGPAVKANYDKKFKSAPIAVKAGDETANLVVTGNLKPELTFKPNYEQIAEEIARRGASQIASDVIMGAIDVALVAGPPLLVAAITAHAIYIAGEKGKRDADILAGAKDASQAAMDFAQMMCGSDTATGTGSISQQAHQRARSELAGIAARNKVSVDQLMTELRNQTKPTDFSRIYNQTKQQALAAYHGKVGDAIAAWRKEHYVAALWTRQEDDFTAVWKLVQMVWK